MKIALHFCCQRAAEILRLGRVDEMAGPAELLERQPELRERASVEVARRNELVARPHQREEGEELGRMPGSGGHRGAAALEGRQPFLEHRDGRVGQPRIDVAEIVQVEERGGVVDVVEHVGRRLIDRRRARAGRRVGRGAGMDRARLEAVIEVARRRRALSRPARQRRVRCAVADDAAVDAAPRQFAAEPPELDLRAPVHDDFDPGGLGSRRRLVVADAQLHPNDLCADRDRVGDDARRFLGAAEHVHHVDLVRDFTERRVDLFSEQGFAGDTRIDRDHAIAFALQILHHEVARPVPVRRGADQGDRLHPLKDRADLRVGIGDRFEIGHGPRSAAKAAILLSSLQPATPRAAQAGAPSKAAFDAAGTYSGIPACSRARRTLIEKPAQPVLDQRRERTALFGSLALGAAPGLQGGKQWCARPFVMTNESICQSTWPPQGGIAKMLAIQRQFCSIME